MHLAYYQPILAQRINKQSASGSFNSDLRSEISLACQKHANTSYRWSELYQKDTLPLVATQSEYVIPTYNNIDSIIQLWHEENSQINPIQIVSHRKFNSSGLSTTQTETYPECAIIEQRTGVYTQPTAASTLTVSSSSALDIGISTRVYGIVNGFNDSETITTHATDGTLGVSGTKQFTKVYGWVKASTTIGVLTLSAVPTTIAQIPTGEQTLESRYFSIKFWPIPSSVVNVYYYYKRKQYQLIDDNDFSILSDDHDNAILLLAEYFVTREPKTMALYEATLKELIAKEPAVMDEEVFLDKRFTDYPRSGVSISLGDNYAKIS